MTRARTLVPVDEVAVIITPAGIWWPSTPPAETGGAPITGPVDSANKLAQALTWLTDRGALTTHGTIAQAWVLGIDAVAALGWLVDPGQQAKGVTLRQLQDETRERLAQAVDASRPELEAQGWTLRNGWESGGYRVRLQKLPTGPRVRGRKQQADKDIRVDVVLEPFAWTTGGALGDDEREMLGVLGGEANGTGLPDTETDIDAARVELGRRLAWCVTHLGMLPGVTGSATGASVAERIWREGAERNDEIQAKLDKGESTKEKPSVFPVAAGPLPPLSDPPNGDIEPRISWSRLPAREEIEAADRIAISDQRAAHLGGAGAKLALGDAIPVNQADAQSMLWNSPDADAAIDKAASASQEQGTEVEPKVDTGKWPRGLWQVSLPPPLMMPELAPDWDLLPPFHQTWWEACQSDPESEQWPVVWMTTETLAALAALTTQGGMGLQWCRKFVFILDGWIYPEAGTAMARWQQRMSKAYRTAIAEGDRAMKALVGDVYKGYFGRWAQSPQQWGQYRARHSQPVWYNEIHAMTSARNRRKVAEAIARATAAGFDVRPVGANTDDSTWLVPQGMDPAVLADDDSDGNYNLGRTVIKHLIQITPAARAAMLAATDRREFARAIETAFIDAAAQGAVII